MLSIDTQTAESLPKVVGVIGSPAQVFEQLQQLVPINLELLNIADHLIETDVVLTCDGLIGVIDGNIGLAPNLITCWQQAADYDIPRTVLAVNTVNGRADFDEAIALSELVLCEDITMRYYPIENDEQTKYVGVLDVLRNEILQPGQPPVPADDEHRTLTIGEHEELVELLVHADVSDAAIDESIDNSSIFLKHTSGLPISLPRLQDIWSEAQLVTVYPFDNQVSNQIISKWLSGIKPTWLPTITDGDETCSVAHITEPVGIGVVNGIARLWNYSAATDLEISSKNNEQVQIGSQATSKFVLFDSRIQVEDTIRPINTSYLVTSPRI